MVIPESWFNANSIENIYVIATRQNTIEYFFSKLKVITTPQIIWTPRLGSARAFLSEEDVEEFKLAHILPRRASIIRLPCDDIILRNFT